MTAPDLTTAARLALDALTYHTAQTRPITSTDEAIDALCAALAAPPGLVIESHNERWTGADEDGDPIREVGPMTCQPVSEPRQEPVEYQVGWRIEDDSENAARTFILVQDREDAFNMAPAGTTPQPLYTRPSPAREPLTLTDEQIMDIGGCGPNNGSLSWLLCFARAVLTAAGERT